MNTDSKHYYYFGGSNGLEGQFGVLPKLWVNKKIGDAVQLTVLRTNTLCKMYIYYLLDADWKGHQSNYKSLHTYHGYKMFLRLWNVQMAQPVPTSYLKTKVFFFWKPSSKKWLMVIICWEGENWIWHLYLNLRC